MPNDTPHRAPVILVVDDEVLLRMLATDYFEDAGYEVIEAANGAEALAALRARPDIEAVFTDVQMPGRPDGLALARTVREIGPACAIVVVSGRVTPEAGDLVERSRFMSKPYEGEDAVRTVQELLKRAA